MFENFAKRNVDVTYTSGARTFDKYCLLVQIKIYQKVTSLVLRSFFSNGQNVKSRNLLKRLFALSKNFWPSLKKLFGLPIR